MRSSLLTPVDTQNGGSLLADDLLEHYLRFVIHERSGPLRERLQQGLVERALLGRSPNTVLSAQIISERVAHFSSLPKYPAEVLAQSLNQLVARGDVVVDDPEAEV